MVLSRAGLAIPLLPEVTCPNCWHSFPPEDALWLAEHPDLNQDEKLGENHKLRFLPSRFNLEGAAIDSRGTSCHDLACPECHLKVSRPLFEITPFFLSFLGAPSSGKSYLLAAMTWRMRQAFPNHFCMSFEDSDPESNAMLLEYEAEQFNNLKQDKPTLLAKTIVVGGDLYNTVNMNGVNVTFCRPFLFTLRPDSSHPHAEAKTIQRVICLYDNAGEHFEPGRDSAGAPVTRHLALSETLLFLFDPTQNAKFRTACQEFTDDPQMQAKEELGRGESRVRQDVILSEAAARVRKYGGLGQAEKHNKPLIVLVTKYDCWRPLLDNGNLEEPWLNDPKGGPAGLKVDLIKEVSKKLKLLLQQYAPELVSVAESFCDEVYYLPVSATGCSPEDIVGDEAETATNSDRPASGFRPKDIKPIWAEVPLLFPLCLRTRGVIGRAVSKRSNGKK